MTTGNKVDEMSERNRPEGQRGKPESERKKPEELAQLTTLAFDTSTAHLSVAVGRGDECLGSESMAAKRNHSVWLIPLVEQLLVKRSLQMSEIDRIAVGYGPGSYTGIRIGVTAGKMLAWAQRIPLIGISSLEAVAAGADQELWQERRGIGIEIEIGGGEASVDKEVNIELSPLSGLTTWYVPLIDARRDRVYSSLYERSSDGKWRTMKGDRNLPLAEWLLVIAERWAQERRSRPDGKLRIVFSGESKRFAEEISLFAADHQHAGMQVIVEERFPHAQDVLRAARRLDDSDQSDVAKTFDELATHRFEPNYAQSAEADLKFGSQ